MMAIRWCSDDGHIACATCPLPLLLKQSIMSIHLSNEEQAVVNAVRYQPSLSVILPFKSPVFLQTELHYKLKMVLDEVRTRLLSRYSAERAMPVLEKFAGLLGRLDLHTKKQSLAIYVSPLVEKVFYLDVPVEEKIVVDDSFYIRDLVYNKQEPVRYLILQLSAGQSRIYLADGAAFTHIRSHVPENVLAYVQDMAEKAGNFSDPEKHKEILLEKFLHHLDQGLSLVLKEYPLPVFVMGAERVLGHFEKITRNRKSLVQFVHGNYLEASGQELRDVLKPYLARWEDIRERASLAHLEPAMSAGRLEYGMKQVLRAAAEKKGRLLLVEKGLEKENVNEVIENVLLTGGDVEFVGNGRLEKYGGIALVTFY